MSSIGLDKQTPVVFGASSRTDLYRTLSCNFTDRFERIFTMIEVLVDLVAVECAVVVAHWSYRGLHLGRQVHYSGKTVAAAGFLLAIVFALLLDRDGGYRPGNGLLRVKETERILRVSIICFLIAMVISFAVRSHLSRWTVTLAFVLVPLFVIIGKQAVLLGLRAMHEHGYGVRNALIYGAGFTGQRVFSALARSPKLGLAPVAVVDDNPWRTGDTVFESAYRRERSVSVVSGPITEALLQQYQVGMVLVAIPSLARENFSQVLRVTMAAKAKLAFVPNHAVPSGLWTDHADVDGLLLTTVGNPASKFLYDAFKRVFDFVCALAIVVCASPVLLLIAALVRLDSPGPVLFKQTRVGKNGRLFGLYKFRSMRADAPAYAFSPKAVSDPRITRLGRLLRRTSLDELPQLINVLKGDMSLVGPRPEMPFIVEQYNEKQRQRLQVIPGITGLWQLSADRALLIHENIQYDLYYIRNRSFFMDIAILLHTILFAMRGV